MSFAKAVGIGPVRLLRDRILQYNSGNENDIFENCYVFSVLETAILKVNDDI